MIMDDRLERAPRRLWIAAISVICVLGHTATVRAQSAEAEALFTEGDTLMKQSKLAEACDAFEASNRIETRAGTLIRLGECREKNHQLASAWSAYKDALTRVKDAKKRAIATERVTQLEAKLSYLTVSVPDESRVDGLALTRNGQPLDPALWNRAVPVNGGEYAIGGRAPGHEEWKTTVTVPNEAGKISVEIPKFKELGKLVPLPPDRPPPDRVVPVTQPPDGEERDDGSPPSRWTTKRKAALGVSGVAAVGLVAGIVLGTQAKGKQDDAHAQCPDPGVPCAGADQAEVLLKAGQNRALGANIAFGVAGAAVIVAGVLWFTGAPEQAPRRVAIVPAIATDTATITVLGRF
jgi:hypothetical protein